MATEMDAAFAPGVGVSAACGALGLAGTRVYRRPKSPGASPMAPGPHEAALPALRFGLVKNQPPFSPLMPPSRSRKLYLGRPFVVAASEDVYATLLGPVTRASYYLSVLVDIGSRNITGWLLADHEQAALAKRPITGATAKQAIPGGQFTLHADRGTAVISKPVAGLRSDMGVARRYSRS